LNVAVAFARGVTENESKKFNCRVTWVLSNQTVQLRAVCCFVQLSIKGFTWQFLIAILFFLYTDTLTERQ
jgi:hypothetical protein